jgi:1,4-alpha-glucan branching enzyme
MAATATWHGVLDAHPWNGSGITIRVLRTARVQDRPDRAARRAASIDMEHDFEGVWQLQLDLPTKPDYRVLCDYGDGFVHRQDDPYRFLPTLG